MRSPKEAVRSVRLAGVRNVNGKDTGAPESRRKAAWSESAVVGRRVSAGAEMKNKKE